MIAYCPSCYQPSRIPPIDHDVLHCPHCAQEFASHLSDDYELSSFRTNVVEPPPVSLMHSGFDQEVDTDQDSNELDIFVEPDQIDDDSEFVLQSVDSSRGSRSSDDGSDMELEVTPTRRKKQKSPIGSLIGVVFGGVAALPIATAILWYGLGTDPLKLAPKVAEYAPWIVPDRLLGTPLAQSSTQSSFQQTNPAPTNADSHFTDDQLRAANEAASQPNSESFTTKKPEINAEEPKEAAPLPFAADEQPSQVDGKLLLAFSSLERSFDAMLSAKDGSSVSSFLDSWQRYVELLDTNDTKTSDTQLEKLQVRLTELGDLELLKKLFIESRARFNASQLTNALGYADALQILKIEPQSDSQSVLLAPTSKVNDPIKSMRIIGPANQFPTDIEPGKSPIYLLFGMAKRDNADGKTTLRVLMSRPL